MRKVLKIYDKTYEVTEKGHDVDDGILRCETIGTRPTTKTEFKAPYGAKLKSKKTND